MPSPLAEARYVDTRPIVGQEHVRNLAGGVHSERAAVGDRERRWTGIADLLTNLAGGKGE